MSTLTPRILLLVLISVISVRAAEPTVFPTVSFYTLSKQRVTLPADLSSDRNLLLLYFDLTQQRDVDDWNQVIDRWHSNDPALASYTSLVSPQRNFLSRWWQNYSMRSASPDAHRWATTLPLYVDKHAFEHQLGISSEKQVILLLTDRKGHILGMIGGAPSNANRVAMRSALHAAGSPMAPLPGTPNAQAPL